MKCPVDGAVLVMSERSGIEIDYCPECRGVWLDRGELDKILEKAVAAETPAAPAPVAPVAPAAPATPSVADTYAQEQASRRDAYSGYERPRQSAPQYPQQGYDKRGGYDQRKKKRKHWLEELFD